MKLATRGVRSSTKIVNILGRVLARTPLGEHTTQPLTLSQQHKGYPSQFFPQSTRSASQFRRLGACHASQQILATFTALLNNRSLNAHKTECQQWVTNGQRQRFPRGCARSNETSDTSEGEIASISDRQFSSYRQFSLKVQGESQSQPSRKSKTFTGSIARISTKLHRFLFSIVVEFLRGQTDAQTNRRTDAYENSTCFASMTGGQVVIMIIYTFLSSHKVVTAEVIKCGP